LRDEGLLVVERGTAAIDVVISRLDRIDYRRDELDEISTLAADEQRYEE